jgi:hypothetical protein
VNDLKIGSIVFEKNQWYSFDVCRCHSVENITGTRWFVSIAIKNDQGYFSRDLVNDYPSLLKHRVKLT